jgi:hypothetical protein
VKELKTFRKHDKKQAILIDFFGKIPYNDGGAFCQYSEKGRTPL